MMFDVVVGNPPFGVDKNGSSRFLHYRIMKNSLSLCREFLCFIMPSKPIIRQLTDEWYDMFRNAVCTRVDVVGQETFKETQMDKTAIYYCDRKADKKDLCKKFDVDRRIYEMIDEEGHRLFIDKMSKMDYIVPVFRFDKHRPNYVDKLKDGKFYICVNVTAGVGSSLLWITNRFYKLGIRDVKGMIELFTPDQKRKNVIECPSYEYAFNLREMFKTSLVFKYGLWLKQIDQNITILQFKYIPSLDYSKIDNDLDLLLACGFTREEADTVLTYLSTFDFTRNRNDMVRDYDCDCEGRERRPI